MQIGISPESPGKASRRRKLLRFDINGVGLFVYDQGASLAADRVAGELWGDAYGLETVGFRPGGSVSQTLPAGN